jgi:hypothetical protein
MAPVWLHSNIRDVREATAARYGAPEMALTLVYRRGKSWSRLKRLAIIQGAGTVLEDVGKGKTRQGILHGLSIVGTRALGNGVMDVPGTHGPPGLSYAILRDDDSMPTLDCPSNPTSC